MVHFQQWGLHINILVDTVCLMGRHFDSFKRSDFSMHTVYLFSRCANAVSRRWGIVDRDERRNCRVTMLGTLLRLVV